MADGDPPHPPAASHPPDLSDPAPRPPRASPPAPVRIDYARPGLPAGGYLSDLRLVVVTVAVTVGAVVALAAALFVLGAAAWWVGRTVRGTP